MCFVLYAGTSKPMPRKEWRNEAPDLSVKTLTERESPITAHFSKPEVQYIGSTSDCGCDFPHVMFQNGDWPWFEDADDDELNRQRKATEPQPRRASYANTADRRIECRILRSLGWRLRLQNRHQRLMKKSTWRQYSTLLFASKSRGFTGCV